MAIPQKHLDAADSDNLAQVEIGNTVWLPRMYPMEQWVVGAVVINERGEAFLQRRSLDRKLFPGCWDIIGGHVEPEESILQALAREMTEETGWTLRAIHATLGPYSWTTDGQNCFEVDFVVSIEGDLDQPTIETAKNSEFRWISRNDIETLSENRVPGDNLTLQVVTAAFIYTESTLT